MTQCSPDSVQYWKDKLFACELELKQARDTLAQSAALTDGRDLYAYIPDIVKNAMLTMWNYICDDSKCHPLDIEHGRGKVLIFDPKHWAQFTGEMVQRNIRDLFAGTPPQAASKFDAELVNNQCKLGDYCKCCAGKPRLCPNYEGPGAVAPPQGARENGLLAEFFSHSAIDEAMQDAWNDICTDTGCHPLDIEHGKGKHLTFSPNHWANQIAKRLFLRAVKVQLKADANALSRPQCPEEEK